MTHQFTKLASCLAALAGTLFATNAQAVGTNAGTIITNSATGTFTYGGNSSTVQSNTVNIRVDEVLDVATASLSGSAMQVGGSSVAVPFRIRW